MKKLLLILCLGLPLTLFSQGTLEKIFYQLPPEYTLDFDLEKKKEVIAEMKSVNSDAMKVDEKNGFLVYGAYQCKYTLCYWNATHESSGKSWKVIAIDGVNICNGNIFFFKEYEGKLEHYHDPLFDNFNASYFFKESAKWSDIKGVMDQYYFELPQTGYTITAWFGSKMAGQPETPRNLLKGNRVDFTWNNGSFTMGQPYFIQ